MYDLSVKLLSVMNDAQLLKIIRDNEIPHAERKKAVDTMTVRLNGYILSDKSDNEPELPLAPIEGKGK